MRQNTGNIQFTVAELLGSYLFHNHYSVDNWLGSPFDDIRPLHDSDWQLIMPILRARFRSLAKKRGFEEIMDNAAKGTTNHYLSNKGWVYKMFVRKLHDNQRRKIIEPLRDRFEQKLKMKSYICNHCGENFRPYQNQPCFAHRFDTATLSPQFEKNAWFLTCCPDRLFFARSGQPLPEVRHGLGICPLSCGDTEHFSDEFLNLISPRTELQTKEQRQFGFYDPDRALYGAAEKAGSSLKPKNLATNGFLNNQSGYINSQIIPNTLQPPPYGSSIPVANSQFYPYTHISYPVDQTRNYENPRMQNFYDQNTPQNITYTNSVNANFNASNQMTSLADQFTNCKIKNQNSNKSRLPNPKREFRFEDEDWDDFFDNDFEFQPDELKPDDESSKKRKNFKLSKKSDRGKDRNGRITEKLTENYVNMTNGDNMVTPRINPGSDTHFDNPPGEFEIGMWKPE